MVRLGGEVDVVLRILVGEALPGEGQEMETKWRGVWMVLEKAYKGAPAVDSGRHTHILSRPAAFSFSPILHYFLLGKSQN